MMMESSLFSIEKRGVEDGRFIVSDQTARRIGVIDVFGFFFIIYSESEVLVIEEV